MKKDSGKTLIYKEAEGFYTIGDLEKLYEETAKQLKRSTWTRVARRVKTQNITTKFEGVEKNGDILFSTNSGTTKGKRWHQRIRFKDLKEGIQILYDDPTLTQKQIINLVVSGDLLVHCDDPSFKYYWSYKAWVQGYGIRKETRYPKVRNPKLTGGVCKHLYAVLSILPFYINTIVGEYKRLGILPKDWEKTRRKRK